MLYLILAILASTLVAVAMRWSERRGKGRIAMLAFNYVICTILAAFYTVLPKGGAIGTTLGLGFVNGVLFLGSFVLLQWCVSRSGVILSSTFMKLGVLVPTLLSILVFGESPRLTQVLGIVLTVAAILLMNLSGKTGRLVGLGGLLLLTIGGGTTDGMAKVYEMVGDPEQKGLYLLITFVVAMVLCTVLMFKRGQRPNKADLIDGAIIGIPNFFSARFLLLSLADVPAVVAYPTYSVATIAAVSLIGVAAFRERLTRRQWAAMAVVAAALVLLNV